MWILTKEPPDPKTSTPAADIYPMRTARKNREPGWAPSIVMALFISVTAAILLTSSVMPPIHTASAEMTRSGLSRCEDHAESRRAMGETGSLRGVLKYEHC